jgi:DNA-binding MarR family transcriptional regulator
MDKLNRLRHVEIGEACICANLRKASRLISQIYDEFLRPCGLKTTQFGLLMMIEGFERSTVTKMAKWGVYERTTFTRNLKLLEKRGLIGIEPGADQRERIVTITDKGSTALRSGLPLWEKAQNYVAEIIGDDKKEHVVKELSSMVTLLRKK